MDWLRLLLYPEGEGGGGGDAGASSEGADGGTATQDPPEGGEEGVEGEQDPEQDLNQEDVDGEGSGEGSGEGEEGAEGSEGEPKVEDKRLIPGYVRELQKTNPEGYKKAKADFFDLKARRSLHETVQQAQEEHGLIESLGGREGIGKLQESVGTYNDLNKQFINADPAFVKNLFEENAIAAGLLIQPMLEEYKTRDEAGYKDAVARLFINEMEQVGLEGGLHSLTQLIHAGKKDEALKLLGEVVGWTKDLKGLVRAEDPRVKSLLAKEAKGREDAEKTAHQDFLKSYSTETINDVMGAVAKTFDQYFKNKKLSKDDRNDLLREVASAANRAVQADKSFVQQRDSHLQRRDAASAKRLVMSRYQREIGPAVQKVARRYGLISGKAPQQGKPQGGPGNNGKPAVKPAASGFVKVEARPRAPEIDRSQTSDFDIAIGKKAVLKDGRKVTWAHLSGQRAS